MAGYFLVADDTWAPTIYAELVGLVATGVVVVGVVRYRPAAQTAWWWIAAGQLLNVLGTLAEAILGRVLQLETWPSAADVPWLGLYPCLVIGLLLLIRLRIARVADDDLGGQHATKGMGLLGQDCLAPAALTDCALPVPHQQPRHPGEPLNEPPPAGDQVLIIGTWVSG